MAGQILGRTDELRQVFAFLDDDTPRARAVVLRGEAGIGKTTIWRAGVRHAEELGLRALVAQPAESEAGLPYAGLADLFATVTDDALDRLPPQQRAAVGAALARTAHARPLDPHALARGDGRAPGRRGVRGPLARGNRRRAVARRTDGRGTGLRPPAARVGAAPGPGVHAYRDRPAAATRRSVLESWEQPPRWIDVGPLAPTELGALLREALGEDLPRPRVELLARASGGNPMFALELARQPATGTAVPASLAQTLATRIGELEPAGQAAVTVAAAALQPSIDLLLQAGVEEQGIRSAVDAGILVRDGDALSFAHPLLASAAYEALLPTERREVHARLAALSTGPIEQAHHVSRSATGPSERAAETLEAGARVAAELGDHAGAASFLLRAAELSPVTAGERPDGAAPARPRSSRWPAT